MIVNCKQGDTSCELSEVVFAAKYNDALVHQTLTSFLSSTRNNIVANKTRGEVRGHARKPWRQKGSGRARAGSSKGPLWRGGGVTFASGRPNWDRKINRKAYRASLRTILSQILREERLSVIEQSYDGAPKTRELVAWRQEMGFTESTLLIVAEVSQDLLLASRNLYDFEVCTPRQINPVKLLARKQVVISTEAVAALNQDLA